MTKRTTPNIVDLILVSYVSSAQIKSELSTKLLKQLLLKSRANHISCKDLPSFLRKTSIEPKYIALIDKYANEDLVFKYKWLNLLAYVSDILRSKDIRHVFIKTLKYPLAIMSDIDVLIPRSDIHKALHSLTRAGFRATRSLFSDQGRYVLRMPKIEIDVEFYPDGLWWRRRICNGLNIVERRRYVTIEGIKVFCPSPEDDLYFVAVHGFYDLKITLAAILHGVQILNENRHSFDWKYLINLASNYGTEDAIIFYLLVLKQFYENYHCSTRLLSLPSLISSFEGLRVYKYIKAWYDKKGQDSLSFPIYVPFTMGRLQSFINYYATSFRLRRSFLIDMVYDLLSQISHLDFNLRMQIEKIQMSTDGCT